MPEDTESCARSSPAAARRRRAARRRPIVPRAALALAVAAVACGGEGTGGGADADGAPPGDAGRIEGADGADAAAFGGRDPLAVDWRVLGNEPFWNVEMSRSGLVLRRIDRDSVVFPPARLEGDGDATRLVSTTDGRTLEVTLRPEPCSDGMSDRRYDWSASVATDGETLRGCAIRDPLPIPEGEEGEAAGASMLADQVAYARRLRATNGRYARVEGTLGTRRGASADFVAWFEGEDPVTIDLTIANGRRSLFETSYFFEPDPRGGEPRLRLVESDRWDEQTGEHTSYVLAFAADGTPVGGTYLVEGREVEPPLGLPGAEQAGAADLVAAARARLHSPPRLSRT